MTSSGMARPPAEDPPAPERTEQTEAERLVTVELFARAVARCRAVMRFHELHPPVANPDAVYAVWRETLGVLDSWAAYAGREDRWYGVGWPHDVDRSRLHVGVGLARALVDGVPPTG